MSDHSEIIASAEKKLQLWRIGKGEALCCWKVFRWISKRQKKVETFLATSTLTLIGLMPPLSAPGRTCVGAVSDRLGGLMVVCSRGYLMIFMYDSQPDAKIVVALKIRSHSPVEAVNNQFLHRYGLTYCFEWCYQPWLAGGATTSKLNPRVETQTIFHHKYMVSMGKPLQHQSKVPASSHNTTLLFEMWNNRKNIRKNQTLISWYTYAKTLLEHQETIKGERFPKRLNPITRSTKIRKTKCTVDNIKHIEYSKHLEMDFALFML